MNLLPVRVAVLSTAERFLARVAALAESWRERVAICPDCGRNRYRNPSCRVCPEAPAEPVEPRRYQKPPADPFEPRRRYDRRTK